MDGLHSPKKLETNGAGKVGVAKGGTGKCGGKVSIICAGGKIYSVITNFEANIIK